tara:strand:- start:114 stop:1142 length:1029 start_codon:yes stop_codon:yes gene_type:complete
MLKKVKLDEAIGMVLGHDMTKVIPGEYKGVAFRRGHIIRREDIPELLSIGKEHIYIMEGEAGVHEEDAALRIAKAVSGADMELSTPSEGRINIKTKFHGLLKVNVPLLEEINSIGEIVLATQHTNAICKSGATVAGTKIVPLYIAENKLDKLEKLCQAKGRVLEIIPFKVKKVGVVITGSEVFKGRIKDKFGETIAKKVGALGSMINHQTIVPDDKALIAQAIIEMKSRGSEVIFVCGGLSVDPDDVTAEGVKESGGRIISYGAPVMPGTMFLYAMLQDIPILGAPACVLYNEATVIDVMLPRLLADDQVTREDIIKLGHGGLCLSCEECHFIVCPFCRSTV